jgi:hypothetical protein
MEILNLNLSYTEFFARSMQPIIQAAILATESLSFELSYIELFMGEQEDPLSKSRATLW